MADVIEINMSTLDLDAGEMADELQALRDEMNKAYTSVQELDMMWNGPANDAFNKAFADDQLLMENMCNTMQSLIDFMTNASGEYKTCESNVSAEIDAIKI
jgi:WXG100 family type VII secretion target